MTVTASFQPQRITSIPGEPAALVLRVHNDDDGGQTVKLTPTGELADRTMLQANTLELQPGEIFEVPVVVDVNADLPAGVHSSSVAVASPSGDVQADATIEVLETTAYGAALQPPVSRSATAGRHRVVLANQGNTPMLVELFADPLGDHARVELATEATHLDPGAEAKVDLRVVPTNKFWRGTMVEHEFVVHATGSDGRMVELPGRYQQTPRMAPWLLPALAGALLALLIGGLLWWLVLEPRVESIAEQQADEALAADRLALLELIAQLEQSAAEAEELPFGTPADLRLQASAAAGETATESYIVSSGRQLSITDIVFQNPNGAIGSVALLRDDEVLLESELANFRDLDFHFVAPFSYDGGSTVAIELTCDTPGPGTQECSVGTSIVGFVDEAG